MLVEDLLGGQAALEHLHLLLRLQVDLQPLLRLQQVALQRGLELLQRMEEPSPSRYQTHSSSTSSPYCIFIFNSPLNHPSANTDPRAVSTTSAPGTVGTAILPDPTELLHASRVLLAAAPPSLPQKSPQKGAVKAEALTKPGFSVHISHEGSAEGEMPFPQREHDLRLCPTSSYLSAKKLVRMENEVKFSSNGPEGRV